MGIAIEVERDVLEDAWDIAQGASVMVVFNRMKEKVYCIGSMDMSHAL